MANQLLQDADLVYVRAEAEKSLMDICEVHTVSSIDDTIGGYTEYWAMAYKNVRCRLADRTGKEVGLANREVVAGDWVLTLPYDQNITAGMRVVHEGDTYAVVFVNGARSYDTTRRCTLRRFE